MISTINLLNQFSEMKNFLSTLLSLLIVNSLMAQEGGTDCASAVNININGTCISGATVSDNTATSPALTSCTGTFSREEWYKFTVSAGPQNVTITGVTTNGNLLIQAISETGSCTGLAEIGCANSDAGNNTGQTETVNLTSLANGTYYLKIVNIGTGGGAGTMALSSLCVTSASNNDLCANTVAVSCGNTYAGTTTSATTTGDPTATCGTAPSAPGVWYKFTGTGQTVTASLCGGATWDTKINVYSGSCASLTCINGNDDGCSTQSTITFNTVVGTDYYILVNGYSGATGTFTLSLTCCTPASPGCATSPSPANNAGGVTICNPSLSWTAPSSTGCNGATSYDVYFGTSSTPPYVTNTTGTSYTPPSLTSSTTYYWQIRPKNGSGTTTGCTTWSFTTAPSANPNYALIDDAVASGSCTTLTSNINDQRGCTWDVNSTLNMTTGWSYDFTVNLGSNDNGADGMAFVIQNDSRGRCACGTSGGSLGAGGITNSLIVEIDTYLNAQDRDDGALMTAAGVLCTGGTEPDHLDIWLNGNINPSGSGCPTPAGTRVISSAAPTMSAGVLYNIENGLNHILRVSWAAGSPGTLTAKLLNTALTYTFATVSYAFDPMTVFGTNTPYFGFTASTGGLNNTQSFCEPLALLPIELLYLSATCEQNDVQIKWSTATELNNKEFELERSKDGIHYSTIAVLPGHGTSSTQHDYFFKDVDANNFTYYYRLKQIDYNGKTEYFNAVTDNTCQTKNSEISIYPNPANDVVTIKLENRGQTKIEIFNDCGQIVFDSEFADKNELEITTSDLAVGVYAVRVSNQYKTVVKKLSVNH